MRDICFRRAYPRSRAELSRVKKAASAAAFARTTYPFSYGVVRRLPPGSVDLDWDELKDDEPLTDLLMMAVTPGESQGLEDIGITLPGWIESAKPEGMTDLGFILDILAKSPLSAQQQAYVYDALSLHVCYEGPALSGIVLPAGRVHYQKAPLRKEHFPLAPVIKRPIRAARVPGRRIVEVSLQALCARDLELYPLSYANEDDATLVSCGRGVKIALVGVLPGYRSPLEALYFFLVLKNGVPVGYGPAGVFCGCCEMGINLFPEFRGGEIRYIYAQFMRVLRHVLGVEYYFLTWYGMGELNEEALRSGAFWFYRKLGFRASNPEVEALAKAEEEKMRARPGYKSDLRTLRRLSHTWAYFDLSEGRCRPFPFGALGVAQTRFVAKRFRGDRAKAERQCDARIRRLFGVSYLPLAVTLCMIPDLGRWSEADKSMLARILRAKQGRSEIRAALLMKKHTRLRRALEGLLPAGDGSLMPG